MSNARHRPGTHIFHLYGFVLSVAHNILYFEDIYATTAHDTDKYEYFSGRCCLSSIPLRLSPFRVNQIIWLVNVSLFVLKR